MQRQKQYAYSPALTVSLGTRHTVVSVDLHYVPIALLADGLQRETLIVYGLPFCDVLI